MTQENYLHLVGFGGNEVTVNFFVFENGCVDFVVIALNIATRPITAAF